MGRYVWRIGWTMMFVVGLMMTSQVNLSAGQESGRENERPIEFGFRVDLDSKVLGRQVGMNICLPDSFHEVSSIHTYPVILINGSHGQQFFLTLAGVVKHLAERERIPECIVVSLDEMGEIPDIFTNGMWGRDKIAGDANPARCIEHLKLEVFPFLQEKYRANDYRIMIGVSGSCLFPIHSFLQSPDLYDSLVLVAAADMVGMGYAEGETFTDEFHRCLNNHNHGAKKIYLGASSDDVRRNPRYRNAIEAFSKTLGPVEQLTVVAEVVPETEHYEVFLPSILTALNQNFPKQKWSARYREIVANGNALDCLDRHYNELSVEYGFTVLPRTDRWNSANSLTFLVRYLIRQNREEEAVQVGQRLVEYRPTAKSYARLSAAFHANKQSLEAIGALKKAIEIAEAGHDPALSSYQQQLEEIQK